MIAAVLVMLYPNSLPELLLCRVRSQSLPFRGYCVTPCSSANADARTDDRNAT